MQDLVNYYHEVTEADYCVCGGLLGFAWIKDDEPVRTCDRCYQDIPVSVSVSWPNMSFEADLE